MKIDNFLKENDKWSKKLISSFLSNPSHAELMRTAVQKIIFVFNTFEQVRRWLGQKES